MSNLKLSAAYNRSPQHRIKSNLKMLMNHNDTLPAAVAHNALHAVIIILTTI